MTASTPGPGRSVRCSDTARERCDPLVGTAAPARRWFLIEHPGPWRIDAFAGSGIQADIQQRIVDAARAGGARILLIRRPGRRVQQSSRAWAVISHDGPSHWGSWEADGDLLAAIEPLSAPAQSAPAQSAPVPSFEPPDSRADDPSNQALLICAHGVHDACCAIRGRPVAAALADRWPAATWECSHVGGDRFAANLVVVPDGIYYGGLDPDTAVDVVAEHLAGRVSARHLRGVSTAIPLAQAAIAAVHERYGPAGPRDVGVDGILPGDDGHWLVQLRAAAPLPMSLVATLAVGQRPAAKLTCRAQMDSAVNQFDLVDLVVTQHESSEQA